MASVCPASRCSCVSPTQTIARIPARKAASALASTIGIALAMVGAAFGMACDHISRAAILQLLGGNIAGMGARGFGVAILAADGDFSGRRLDRRADQGRGRADQHFRLPRLGARGGGDGGDFRQRGFHPVHFPVSGGERTNRAHQKLPSMLCLADSRRQKLCPVGRLTRGSAQKPNAQSR